MAQQYVKVAASRARVVEAEANYCQALTDREHYANLSERQTVPKQTMDRFNALSRVIRDALEQSQQLLKESLAIIGGYAHIPLDQQPALKEVKALLEQALLNREYTQVKAEVAGYLVKRQVQPGNWVHPGQPLMALVPLDYPGLWIEASY